MTGDGVPAGRNAAANAARRFVASRRAAGGRGATAITGAALEEVWRLRCALGSVTSAALAAAKALAWHDGEAGDDAFERIAAAREGTWSR